MSNENSLNGSRASTTAAAGTTTRLLLLSSRARNKGPYFNDVYKIFGILYPLPPFVTHSRNLSVQFVTLWVTPLPPRA